MAIVAYRSHVLIIDAMVELASTVFIIKIEAGSGIKLWVPNQCTKTLVSMVALELHTLPP